MFVDSRHLSICHKNTQICKIETEKAHNDRFELLYCENPTGI